MGCPRVAALGVRVSVRPVAVSHAHRRVRVAVVPDVLALGGLALLCLVFVVITIPLARLTDWLISRDRASQARS